MRAHQWVELAWVSVVLVFVAVIILQERRAGPVQTIERDLSWAESPAEIYYGERDTSVLRWVCCRGVGR